MSAPLAPLSQNMSNIINESQIKVWARAIYKTLDKEPPASIEEIPYFIISEQRSEDGMKVEWSAQWKSEEFQFKDLQKKALAEAAIRKELQRIKPKSVSIIILRNDHYTTQKISLGQDGKATAWKTYNSLGGGGNRLPTDFLATIKESESIAVQPQGSANNCWMHSVFNAATSDPSNSTDTTLSSQPRLTDKYFKEEALCNLAIDYLRMNAPWSDEARAIIDIIDKERYFIGNDKALPGLLRSIIDSQIMTRQVKIEKINSILQYIRGNKTGTIYFSRLQELAAQGTPISQEEQSQINAELFETFQNAVNNLKTTYQIIEKNEYANEVIEYNKRIMEIKQQFHDNPDMSKRKKKELQLEDTAIREEARRTVINYQNTLKEITNIILSVIGKTPDSLKNQLTIQEKETRKIDGQDTEVDITKVNMLHLSYERKAKAIVEKIEEFITGKEQPPETAEELGILIIDDILRNPGERPNSTEYQARIDATYTEWQEEIDRVVNDKRTILEGIVSTISGTIAPHHAAQAEEAPPEEDSDRVETSRHHHDSSPGQMPNRDGDEAAANTIPVLEASLPTNEGSSTQDTLLSPESDTLAGGDLISKSINKDDQLLKQDFTQTNIPVVRSFRSGLSENSQAVAALDNIIRSNSSKIPEESAKVQEIDDNQRLRQLLLTKIKVCDKHKEAFLQLSLRLLTIRQRNNDQTLLDTYKEELREVAVKLKMKAKGFGENAGTITLNGKELNAIITRGDINAEARAEAESKFTQLQDYVHMAITKLTLDREVLTLIEQRRCHLASREGVPLEPDRIRSLSRAATATTAIRAR